MWKCRARITLQGFQNPMDGIQSQNRIHWNQKRICRNQKMTLLIPLQVLYIL